MQSLLAKPVRDAVLSRVSQGVSQFVNKTGRRPKLVVLLVGQDPASVIYTNKKGEVASSVGFEHETIRFPSTASKEEVGQCVEKLNRDTFVDGILIQRPLPKSFEEEEVSNWVDPAKDVDAFHPENIGRLSLGLPTFSPCTPSGIIELLKFYQIPLEGRIACVVGRSQIVGKPMAQLLLKENATVIHCHSKTSQLSSLTRLADLVIVAAGKPKLIDASFIKKGSVVVDVGVHRLKDGSLCGDVEAESVGKVASFLTPVPGGVGPMTIAMLMENTLFAAQRRES